MVNAKVHIILLNIWKMIEKKKKKNWKFSFKKLNLTISEICKEDSKLDLKILLKAS